MANSPKILLTPPNLINYIENPSFRSILFLPLYSVSITILACGFF
jgi:hypothetical protein